jgi:predicted nucleic acid-binding protein
MTMVIVLDASVAISLLRDENTSAQVRAALRSWANDGVSIVVPAPFWAEVVNSLTKRHGYSGSAVIEALFEVDQLRITTLDVDRPLLLAGLDLVERSGLTIYDALYLALARSLGAKLATFDGALIAAAGPDAIDLWADTGGPGHGLAEERAPYGSTQRQVTWPSWPGAGAYLATLRRQAMSGR